MAKYYTPIAQKAPANAETFNAPLAELDTQIDSNAQQLAEQLALLQAHAAALQQQLAAIQTNASAIAAQGELVEELAADSTVHDQQLEALDGRLDTAEADIQSQGTAIDGLTSRIGTAETDIDELQTAVDGLDDGLTDVATDVSGLKADMTDVKGRMTTAESGITSLDADMTATKGRLTTAEGDIDSLETDVDGLDTRVTAAEGDIDTLEADMTATQGRLTTAEGDIDNLETDVDGLDTRVTDLEQTPGYTLPAATASDLGGVKVGDGLEIDQDGVLSASGGGGSDVPYYFAVCNTASATTRKTVTIEGVTELFDGMILDVYFANGISQSRPTLQINSLNAVYIGAYLEYLPSSSYGCVIRIVYSAKQNIFLPTLVGSAYRASKADSLINSPLLDGLNFGGNYTFTHYLSVPTAAADENKIIASTAFKDTTDNFNLAGLFYRVFFKYGNTSRRMFFKVSSTSTAVPILNSAGGTEMPDIPEGGMATIVLNPTKRAYMLVSVIEESTTITAASDTDTVLDDLTINKDYRIEISGVNYLLKNIYTTEDLHEQYLYARPATITPGSTATPVRKYRCREWDATNSEWLGWTEWTTI